MAKDAGLMRALAGVLPVLAMMVSAVGAAASPPAQIAPATSAPAMGPVTGDAVLDSYRLGVGDRLTVTVYGEDKIGGPVTIDPDGSITMPLAGRIAAEGKTIAELTEAIRSALADGYLRYPSVAVQVLSLRPFYILGEVNKPGEYAFSKGLTVMDAIAIAAGFTYRARKSGVFITHRGQARETRMIVTPGLLVVPGDTIRVGERYF